MNSVEITPAASLPAHSRLAPTFFLTFPVEFFGCPLYVIVSHAPVLLSRIGQGA
jgi:hypothetical protein